MKKNINNTWTKAANVDAEDEGEQQNRTLPMATRKNKNTTKKQQEKPEIKKFWIRFKQKKLYRADGIVKAENPPITKTVRLNKKRNKKQEKTFLKIDI